MNIYRVYRKAAKAHGPAVAQFAMTITHEEEMIVLARRAAGRFNDWRTVLA